MRDWSISDLEYWDEKIREKLDEFGLDCFPQIFEVCDEEQMLGYMSYHGMPAHYPHWSYGKAYERLKTMHRYGVTGLPYEMVINSNESVAYLMKNNSLCLQILTMAHVYGHNDFFKNNYTFKDTHPELTLSNVKSRAGRIREYTEDPGIGRDKVEAILDAAHALSFSCRRNFGIRKVAPEEQVGRALAQSLPPADPYQGIHKKPEREAPDLHKVPLEPEADLLLFIRDHNPYLEDWAKDILTIVHQESQYFIPQMETKIMNEGWASFWHHRILNSLDLPQELALEFIVHHSQVVRPHPGSINPYFLGFKTWHDIVRRYDNPTAEEIEIYGKPSGTGMEKIFAVREVDRDSSFLRQFLHQKLMRQLDMFHYRQKNGDLVVDQVADNDSWQSIKKTLLDGIGMNSVPVILIDDADYDQNRSLHLTHQFDGRELRVEDAEKTLSYLYQLWQRPVFFETVIKGKRLNLTFNEKGFGHEVLAA